MKAKRAIHGKKVIESSKAVDILPRFISGSSNGQILDWQIVNKLKTLQALFRNFFWRKGLNLEMSDFARTKRLRVVWNEGFLLSRLAV